MIALRVAMAFLFLSAIAPARAALFSGPSIEELQHRIARQPAESRSRAKAQLYSDLGTKLYQAGRMAEAAAAFTSALENRTSRALRRHIYLYLGKSYESSGRPDKAVDAYRQALIADPKNWRRHRDLGVLYHRVKLNEEALAALELARDLEPEEPAVHFDLAVVWRDRGFYGYAEAALNRALALGHDKNRVRREMSLVLEGQGRYAEAAFSFEQAVGPAPSAPELARLAYLHSLGRNPAAARAAVDRLRSSGAPKETVEFYDALTKTVAGGPENVLSPAAMDPSLRAMVEGELWHRMD